LRDQSVGVLLAFVAPMSKAFGKVLQGLKDFTSEKIYSIEKLADSHQEWLSAIVEETQRQFASSAGKRSAPPEGTQEKPSKVRIIFKIYMMKVTSLLLC